MSEEAGETIHRATLQLLAERGIDGFTMRDVVERAGVGVATIYRRWPSKGDLVAGTVTRLMAEAAPQPVAGSPTETIRLVTRSLVDLLTTTPVGAALPSIIVEADRNPAVGAIVHGWFARRRHLLKQALQEGVESGEFRADMDLDVAFDILAGPPYYRRYIAREVLSAEYAHRHAEEFIRSALARSATAPPDRG